LPGAPVFDRRAERLQVNPRNPDIRAHERGLIGRRPPGMVALKQGPFR
jgi:hypothetical protein